MKCDCVLSLNPVFVTLCVFYYLFVLHADKAKGLQINLSEALQGKLVAYDTDGDGDFDVEDAKVLLGKLIKLRFTGESQVLDWLEEVEEGGSDWLNGFFTFLYGLINPLEPLEEEEGEHTEAVRGRRQAKDDGNQGQKIVIVGLHNQ
uniref:Aspartyl beta-hydroxylase/Triadin domain-containing protein n=1 Tax=Pundamilia nyererei TaxID=303518 RepID=A0A3B4FCW7_9CICH